MSASPSGFSNGRTPTPGSGPAGAPQYIRKPKVADPLRPRKKPVRPLPSSGVRPNGHPPTRPAGPPKPVNGSLPRPSAAVKTANGAVSSKITGGWSSEPSGAYQDFPLVTTKRAILEMMRFHVARFSGKKDIDPSNQEDFTRPVSLHRRDPRQPPPGRKEEVDETEQVDDKERERQELARLEKEAQRAADLAQIAPTSSKGTTKKPPRQEKTTQVFRLDKTEEQKRQSDLRYEEALPWHLEDADNRNSWVGNYEAALSHTHAAFIRDGSRFRMVPLEKWYKFTPNNQSKMVFSIEEAEAQMKKKMKEPRWFAQMREAQQKDNDVEAARAMMGRMYTVKAESNTFKRAGKREVADMDDLDYEDDLFADDEEHMTVERDRDEETKDTEEKIKREQLGANLFGEGDEAEVEREMEKEEKEAEQRRRLGKKVKKALQKREKNYIYDSDSDHPYSSSSDDDSTDSETQKDKEAEQRKVEEAKLKSKTDSQTGSATSTKGSNTPSGRPKTINALKQSKGVKRSGSPGLSASEASGNESSRKKAKKKHGLSSSQPSGTATPTGRGSITSSSQPVPGAVSRKTSIVRLNVNPSKLSEIRSGSPGAGSDGEATAGEMSDGAGGKKKIKLSFGSASRGVSPAPGRAGSTGGSRAGSPAANRGPITGGEIAAALKPQGSTIGELMSIFQSRVTDRKDFIRLVKENSNYDPATKLLRPRQ